MRLLILSFLLLIHASIQGQDAKTYYEQGVAKAQEGKLEEAIELFTKTIELQPADYYAWYNRGLARTYLNKYEDALKDFDQTLALSPGYKKAWLNRGTAKKHLTDYNGAIEDYSRAIAIDSTYHEAYYNRGLVFEMFDKKETACKDFTKAKDLGSKNAEKRVARCNDTAQTKTKINTILKLSKTATDEKYGFTQENPIKVGTGYDGGPANQHVYLRLLRDAKGNPITYERVGSCCAYESPNGFMGVAMLDKYEITYLNEKGKKKTATIYISFYDYEEPQVLHGFKTVGK